MIDTYLSYDTGFGAGYGSVVYTLPGESIGGADAEAIALKVLFFCWNKYFYIV